MSDHNQINQQKIDKLMIKAKWLLYYVTGFILGRSSRLSLLLMWRSGWEGMIFSVVATVSCKHRGGKLSEVNGKKVGHFHSGIGK